MADWGLISTAEYAEIWSRDDPSFAEKVYTTLVW